MTTGVGGGTLNVEHVWRVWDLIFPIRKIYVINTKRYCGQIAQILLNSYSDLNMDILSTMHWPNIVSTWSGVKMLRTVLARVQQVSWLSKVLQSTKRCDTSANPHSESVETWTSFAAPDVKRRGAKTSVSQLSSSGCNLRQMNILSV